MTVRMIRDETHPEPRSADVHPDEVDAYRAGGWIPDDTAPKRVRRPKEI